MSPFPEHLVPGAKRYIAEHFRKRNGELYSDSALSKIVTKLMESGAVVEIAGARFIDLKKLHAAPEPPDLPRRGRGRPRVFVEK